MTRVPASDRPGARELVIGLEVHCYPATRSKFFCGCSADFLEAEPNTQLCPVCTGQPGAKPGRPNREAIEACLRLLPYLRLSPAERPVPFLRKHYFYPDLPSGYQRTSTPFGRTGAFRSVPLWEAHWEEDPGQYELRQGTVDYNRSGVPLLEIVTAPAMTSPTHARDWLNDLRLLFDYLGFARAGTQFKVDANVSLVGGPRVEIKNVNGIKGVETALTVEAARQREVVAAGGAVERETRHFDEAFATTRLLRRKETVADYRYLPDPDLPSIVVTQAWLRRLSAAAPEDPFARAERNARTHGLAADRVRALVADRPLLEIFERHAASGRAPPAVLLEFLASEVMGELHYRRQGASAIVPLEPALLSLLEARTARRVSDVAATGLLRDLLDGKARPSELPRLITERSSVDDEGPLRAALAAAAAANPKAVADLAAGKEAALNFLVGAALKELKGRADPRRLRELAREVVQAKGG